MQIQRATLGEDVAGIRAAQPQGGALCGDVDRGAAVLAYCPPQVCLEDVAPTVIPR